MPTFGPISRKDLIRNLRKAGFEGPVSGGKHQFMQKGDITLAIPNPHSGKEISKGLLDRLLKQAGISKDEWRSL